MHSSYDLTMQSRDAGERPFKSFPHHPAAQIPTSFYGGHTNNPFSNSGYMPQTSPNCGMQLPITSSHDYSMNQALSSCSGGQGLSIPGGSGDPTQGLHGMTMTSVMTKSEKIDQDPFGSSNTSPNASSSSLNSGSGSSPTHSQTSICDESKDDDGSFKMPPKKRPHTVPDNQKDAIYWEKRKKNNDSAKRSREARRMKEEQIALRVVFLEQENLQLRTEVSLLKSEIEKLRCMLYNG